MKATKLNPNPFLRKSASHNFSLLNLNLAMFNGYIAGCAVLNEAKCLTTTSFLLDSKAKQADLTTRDICMIFLFLGGNLGVKGSRIHGSLLIVSGMQALHAQQPTIILRQFIKQNRSSFGCFMTCTPLQNNSHCYRIINSFQKEILKLSGGNSDRTATYRNVIFPQCYATLL